MQKIRTLEASMLRGSYQPVVLRQLQSGYAARSARQHLVATTARERIGTLVACQRLPVEHNGNSRSTLYGRESLQVTRGTHNGPKGDRI